MVALKLILILHTVCNKLIMPGPKGNSKFCFLFPETLKVSQGDAEGNIEIE